MNIYDFNVIDINEQKVSLSDYRGKVLLIVNVASNCGFTCQYEGLQKLFDQFKNKNFMILAFPSNQFSQQEPGSNEEIKSFCSLTYDIGFDMFSKIDVNGDNTIDLYKHLKKEATGILGTQKIKWNFTKFLISKEGKVYKRYASITEPQSMKKDIEKLLYK